MKHRKRKNGKLLKTLALVLTIVCISGSLVVQAEEEYSDVENYIAEEEYSDLEGYANVQTMLNVREEPATSADVIATLVKGETAKVLSRPNNGWIKITTHLGKTGYVKEEYFVIMDYIAELPPKGNYEGLEMVSEAIITAQNSSENRNFNMSKACSEIDGLILQPGDEFNWYGKGWAGGVVGPACKESGYVEATVISGGKHVKGYGGGVCQVCTAVYNCINKLGIVPTEHHHHSIASSYVEEGMDATVAYKQKNFVFTNTLDYAIQFEAYQNGGQVVVRAYKVD